MEIFWKVYFQVLFSIRLIKTVKHFNIHTWIRTHIYQKIPLIHSTICSFTCQLKLADTVILPRYNKFFFLDKLYIPNFLSSSGTFTLGTKYHPHFLPVCRRNGFICLNDTLWCVYIDKMTGVCNRVRMHKDMNFNLLISAWAPEDRTWFSRLGCYLPGTLIEAGEIGSSPQVAGAGGNLRGIRDKESSPLDLIEVPMETNLILWYGQRWWHTSHVAVKVEAQEAAVGDRSPCATLTWGRFAVWQGLGSGTLWRNYQGSSALLHWHLWHGQERSWLLYGSGVKAKGMRAQWCLLESYRDEGLKEYCIQVWGLSTKQMWIC